jgi:hypothetical protein
MGHLAHTTRVTPLLKALYCGRSKLAVAVENLAFELMLRD